ncbi:MAG TPA: putative toxin-antitoxin system toxin component, PIN family [Chloroflexia bacterium]|nr:putative toxin-antitoxin system toxin component, PIN family [Chloroflexia bacterium]
MRIVADTNTVVSGLLWLGTSRQVLDIARTGKIQLFTSAHLLGELEDVLNRAKFAPRLASAGVTAHDLVLGYAALAVIVEPATLEPVVLADKDDDAVIACAVAAQSEVIVSGDSHLLKLGHHGHIRVLTAAQLMAEIS